LKAMCLIYNILQQIHLSLGRSKNRQMHGPVASHIIIHEQHHAKLKKIQLPFHSLAITKKHVFVGCGEYDCCHYLITMSNLGPEPDWHKLTSF